MIQARKYQGLLCIKAPQVYNGEVTRAVRGKWSKKWSCIVSDWTSFNCAKLIELCQRFGWPVTDEIADTGWPVILGSPQLFPNIKGFPQDQQPIWSLETTLESIQETNLKRQMWQHQKDAFRRLAWMNGAILDMGMGPQPLYSKVMTPYGWALMGEINVGDFVTGADGKPTKVTEVHDFQGKEVYEVTFSDKSSTRCTKEHLWQVSTPKQKHRGTAPQVKTLLEIAAVGLKTSSGWWKHFIPITKPVEFFSKKPDSLDPYFVGLLIGDGCLTNGVHISTPDKEIVNYIEDILPGDLSIKQKSKYDYSISLVDQSYDMKGRNTVLNELKRLGLFGLKSENKFIPSMYLYAPIEDRIALLQGLLDTDGFSEINRAGIEYSTSSPNLASDFEFLVRSLGGTTTKSLKKTKCLDSHRFYVKLPKEIDPFRLTRRKIRYPKSIANPTRSIRDIQLVGVEDVRCIKVENEDGLYITDDFIVTHNTGKTMTTISLIMADKHDIGFIVCPKSVIDVWPLEFFRNSKKDFHILQRGKESIAKFVKNIEKEGHNAQVYKRPFVFICNYEAFWRGELADFIKNNLFDYIVYDEVHRLKTASGSASKFAASIRKNASRVIGGTGTLLPHSPLDAFAIYRAVDPGVFGTHYIPFRSRYAVLGGFEGKQVVDFQNQEELHRILKAISFRIKTEDAVELPPAQHIERFCELSPATRKLYEQMKEDLIAEFDGHTLEAANAMVKVLRLMQCTSGVMKDTDGNEVRVGSEKAELFADIMEDIGQEEPVVVFCNFTADLTAVKEICDKQKRTYSELSGKKNELKEWQDGRTSVLVVQIKAGKEGVDFTRATICFYYSIGHSLGEYLQSERRIHRPGQTRPVVYYHLLAKNSVDVDVYKALDKKHDIVLSVLDGLGIKTSKGASDGNC